MQERSHTRLVAYGLALVAPALTLLVLWPLRPVLGDRVPYMVFLPAVLLAAYLGGFVPGLAATAVGALATTYFLVEPLYSLRLASIPDVVALTLFVLVGAMISGVSEALHRTRRRVVASERQRAEQALRETEEHFRQLAENIREIFWITDARGDRVIYVSPGYEEVWGRTLQSFYEQPGSLLESIHPEDRDKAIEHLAKPGRGELWVREYRVVRPDGSVRWIRGRVFPIKDQFGHLSRIAGLAEDITDRKQAEEDVRQAQSRLELAIRSSNIGIWELQMPDGVLEHGRSNYLNLWEQLGYSPAEFPTTPMDSMELCHPDDRERLRQLVHANLSGETKELKSEHRIRRKDGSYAWTLLRGETVRDGHGRPVSQSGVLLDISDLKRTEEALRESEERFRGTFENAAVGIAHCDGEGRILRVNEKFSSVIGHPSTELVGKTFLEMTHPEDLAADLAQYRPPDAGRIGKLHDGEKIHTPGWGNRLGSPDSLAPARSSE